MSMKNLKYVSKGTQRYSQSVDSKASFIVTTALGY